MQAVDHDFPPQAKLTPFGIFLPGFNELYLYFTSSRLTSDFMVDCLEDFWRTNRGRFPLVRTVLLNQDNGPENHSRRTQFMKRLTAFADAFQVGLDLAYYRPITVNTIPSNGYGACWNSIGMDSYSRA